MLCGVTSGWRWAAGLGAGLMLLVSSVAGQAPLVDLTGVWSGTASDFGVRMGRVDGMTVNWNVSQVGGAITGTVTSGALVPGDGSCSSCHRVKSGTLSGTVTGASVSLSMAFPGNPGEITPLCSVSFTGSAPAVTNAAVTLAYTGTDSCMGVFQDGALVMGRGAAAAPSIAAHPASQALTAGQVATLGVTALGTPPLSYQWYQGSSGITVTPVVGATQSTLTTPAFSSPGSYWVRATNVYGSVDSAAADLTLSAGFTDDPLIAGQSVIRAVHIQELRDRVEALRLQAGLPAFAYSAPVLTPAVTVIRAVHVEELRRSVADVYVARGRTAPVFTHAVLSAVLVRRIHITELRAAITALE